MKWGEEMAEQKEIKCDKCGGTIELEGRVQDRVIGQDGSGNVKERFFECPVCGYHYTITVYNRPMLLKIQKRKALQVKIRRAWGRNSSAQQFRSWVAEDTRLKEELMNEAQTLRRQYLQEE